MAFPDSPITFTTRNPGDTIQPAHVNDVQTEVANMEAGYLNGTARINSSNSTLATLSVTGASTFAGPVVASSGVRVSGSTSSFASSVTMSAGLLVSNGVVSVSTTVYIGDNANANMSRGLTINQGVNDNEILAFKSDDVAHGVTARAETDTYATFLKRAATDGGIQITGYSAATIAMQIDGIGTTDNTGKTTADVGYVVIAGRKRSGTDFADTGANANLLTVANNGTTRFILDADGDSHQDVGTAWTNFDSVDDALALTALALYVSPDSDPYKAQIRGAFGAALDAMIPRDLLVRMKLVTFNPNGHHFVNMSKLAMLHTGAIRQLADRCGRLTERCDAMTGEIGHLKRQLPQGDT